MLPLPSRSNDDGRVEYEITPGIWLLEGRARQRLYNPEKTKARDQFTAAVRSGALVRQPCVRCGQDKSEGHHPDYARPLDVVWLCRQHHRLEHTMNASGDPSAGGKARAEKMTKEARIESAQNAARARWEKQETSNPKSDHPQEPEPDVPDTEWDDSCDPHLGKA